MRQTWGFTPLHTVHHNNTFNIRNITSNYDWNIVITDFTNTQKYTLFSYSNPAQLLPFDISWNASFFCACNKSQCYQWPSLNTRYPLLCIRRLHSAKINASLLLPPNTAHMSTKYGGLHGTMLVIDRSNNTLHHF